MALHRTMLVMLGLCALAGPSRSAAEGGRISGVVTATPARALPDTVVYLRKAPANPAPKRVLLDQKGMAFSPRVLVITAGDTVEFCNHDTVNHNVMSPDHGGYDLGTVPRNGSRTRTFDTPGQWVQLCRLHPEMLGYVFVGQNPFMALVDEKGEFHIDGVPPGTYDLAVWNPKLKAPDQKVVIDGTVPAPVQFHLAR